MICDEIGVGASCKKKQMFIIIFAFYSHQHKKIRKWYLLKTFKQKCGYDKIV